MSRLTRDGTAEPVSRDQILRHVRGQGNIHFPCSARHEQDWQLHLVDPYSAICNDHTPSGQSRVYRVTVIAYRWRSLPRVRRHRASKPQDSSERVLRWQVTMCVCVCFLRIYSGTSSLLDVPAGVTQEEDHTVFLIHLPSAVRALTFLARRTREYLHVDASCQGSMG